MAELEGRSPRMHFIRVGHLSINLEYVIMSEDSMREPEPRTIPDGVLRITTETGRVLDLRGEVADQARRQIDQVASPPPVPRAPRFGQSVPGDHAHPQDMIDREG